MNTKSNQVHELRKAGWKIRVIHKRYFGGIALLSRKEATVSSWRNCLTRGGLTIVELTTPNGKNSTGEARCSKSDNFDRKKGVSIALGRAITNLENQSFKIKLNDFMKWLKDWVGGE